jgi:uncharacterized protein YbaA (DUF1428 family)
MLALIAGHAEVARLPAKAGADISLRGTGAPGFDDKTAYDLAVERGLRAVRGASAVKVVECWGNDVPDGTTTSFPMAVKRKEDETVVFSWITWPSRKVRDEGMKKAMADPRLQPDRNPMPFDGKRLIYGGFEVILDA